MTEKFVYLFGGGKTEGNSKMKNTLGGKGANLAEMSSLGVPVPPGFTISTEMCTVFYKNNRNYPESLSKTVDSAIEHIEATVGKKFGSMDNPLLVSVRSGARASMPGMMDTVLNLGLNDDTVKGLAKQSGNERFAWDSYRRFVQMYGDVVLGMKPETEDEEDPFEILLEAAKKSRGVENDNELLTEDLQDLVVKFKALVKEKKGVDFPATAKEQLWGAINAVFGSWMTKRAIRYRKMNSFDESWGTAVNVQAMVFGNMGDDCATGVAFTRNPATGEKIFYGEYLINAQGEDVVAGIRTPQPINSKTKRDDSQVTLEEAMPKAYQELVDIYLKLEDHYKDMQDIEFTIERGTLWMLQTRTGKRTAQAAVRIAIEMLEEGMIDDKTAVLRVEPNQLDQLLHPTFDTKAVTETLAKGLPASPGAASGRVYFSAEECEKRVAAGESVILVRIETSPEDIGGMDVANGILTARGGMTSHAAVVARGMGKCCVAGCGEISISYTKRQFLVGDIAIKEGDFISLNGSTGEVLKGQVPTVTPELSGNFGKLMELADRYRKLDVRTNADTPKDAKVARNFGAQGIGLCRTEHMFFEGERIKAVREMILSEDLAGREKALEKLLPMQRGDFEGIFKAMEGLPVTVRLLDPPLHEFLPHEEKDQKTMADEMGLTLDKVKKMVDNLHEFNPMLGHRGCRLGLTYPEITKMQARAIIEAACNLKKEGVDVRPEIMIPLIGTDTEFNNQETYVREIAEKVMEEKGIKVDYMVGTMIEVPRAALTADQVAKRAEFFSFGTNDLTQMTCGFSRDDAGKFLPQYVDLGVYDADPFQTLDQSGVGLLVDWAIRKGRGTRPNIKIGICGEHGGEPKSVAFCHRVGMNYVSCSPYRVPIARLAAAHEAIIELNKAEKKTEVVTEKEMEA